MPGFGQVTFFFSFNHSQKWNPKLQIEESGFPYRFSKGRNIARHLQFTLVFSFWNAALLLLLVALYHTNSSTISRISFPPPPFYSHTPFSQSKTRIFLYIRSIFWWQWRWHLLQWLKWLLHGDLLEGQQMPQAPHGSWRRQNALGFFVRGILSWATPLLVKRWVRCSPYVCDKCSGGQPSSSLLLWNTTLQSCWRIKLHLETGVFFHRQHFWKCWCSDPSLQAGSLQPG